MRIVVTGASGNIGTGLLRRLYARLPEASVVGLCRRPPLRESPYDRVQWHTLDLARPDAAVRLREVFVDADAVVHLAWAMQPVRDEAVMQRLNIAGTNAVLDAVAEAGVPHLVYASSVGVYAPGAHSPVDEAWPDTGLRSSAYSRQKVIIERTLDRFAERCPATIVTRFRPPLVTQRAAAEHLASLFLGPLVQPSMFRLLRRGVLPVFPMPAGLTAQFVHADDVGDAVVEILLRRAGGIDNVAAEEIGSHRLAAVLRARALSVPNAVLRACTTALYRMRALAISPGWYDLATRTPIMDTRRARNELDWRPAHILNTRSPN